LNDKCITSLTSEGKSVGLVDTGDKLGDGVLLEGILLGRDDGISEDLTVGVELGYGDGF
jgi:hypothetical protein